MNTILPIGSVVTLKNLDFPVMIFGFLQKNGFQPERYVDYIGVPYPVGNVGMEAQLGFQMEDITEVLFEGYRTEEFDFWAEVLRLRQKSRTVEEGASKE